MAPDTHTSSPFPPIAHLLLAVATLQLSQLLHQSGSAAHHTSPRRCEPAETPEKGDVGVSKNSGIPKIIHFNRVFPYKPSILGAHPYFWKHPLYFCCFVPPSKKVTEMWCPSLQQNGEMCSAAVHGFQDLFRKMTAITLPETNIAPENRPPQ